MILAIGLGFAMGPHWAGAADTAPPLVTSLETVTDGVGDVLSPVATGGFDAGRADITQASVEWAPGWIRMKAQVKTATDPLKDQAWTDANDLEWGFDTNGDGKEDYTVEFATDKGQLYGAVFDASKPDSNTSICDADSASYSPQDGYTLVIDPTCIGNPKSFGWAATIFFDTNAKDAKSPVASDRVPDQGFKPESAPGEAAAAGAPTPAAGAPAPAPGPAVTLRVGPAPGPKSGAAAGRTASGAVPAAPAASAGAPGPAATGSAATPGSAAPGGTVAGAASAADPSNLARTGSASETHALLGLGLMLLGAGIVVMTRPGHRAMSVV